MRLYNLIRDFACHISQLWKWPKPWSQQWELWLAFKKKKKIWLPLDKIATLLKAHVAAEMFYKHPLQYRVDCWYGKSEGKNGTTTSAMFTYTYRVITVRFNIFASSFCHGSRGKDYLVCQSRALNISALQSLTLFSLWLDHYYPYLETPPKTNIPIFHR